MLESGQVFAARYALLRKLGEGRGGEVWLARDRGSGRDVAVKVLGPGQAAVHGAVEAFARAARLHRTLGGEGVLRCLADGEADGQRYAVFEFAPGGDLARLRGRHWRQLLPALTSLAEALHSLHGRGWVHRDLKPANVLLDDAGRAVLADLGLAAPIGAADAERGGSPFSTSPQQLDGEPPAIADDVYAFGALAYELVGGYPPFYPDASAERVRSEPVPPLPQRAQAPAALEQLVLRCLEKRPDDRPADLSSLRAALVACLTASPEDRPQLAPAAGSAQPPAQPVQPLDAEWRRDTVEPRRGARRPAESVRRGALYAALALLLLAAGLVFFALPRWVGGQQAASLPPPAASQPDPGQAAAQRDLERLAGLAREFERLRPDVTRRLEALQGRGAGVWGGAAFAAARGALDAADRAAAKRDFGAAVPQLEAAAGQLDAVERQAQQQLAAALAAGRDALATGNGPEATRQFGLALRIDPASAAAKRGLERVATLDQVREVMAEAGRVEAAGRPAEALALYRQALALDRDAVAAREAIARLQARESGQAFAAAMSRGFAALGAGDYAAARAAFTEAGRIRPGAAEARDALAQVERAAGDSAIAAALARARDAERAERWRDAVVGYRKVLELDANLLEAQQGLERTEPRAMLEAELAAFVERPERLLSAEVRRTARNTLERAAALPDGGAELRRQAGQLAAMLAAAETPVRVGLTSDNRTQVTIHRVGSLGAFERRDMELLPGRYTAVGTRAGFRDVRREFTVLPGATPPAVVIRCEEPI